jgi:hypothetical protein
MIKRGMGRGILAAQLSRFDEIGELTEKKSAWKRREGFNLTYTFADAIKSAFGIFLFQHLSMLGYQESLERGNQRKNAENILNVKEIPCNNQITRLVDEVEPEGFDENFKRGIEQADRYGVLDQYRVLDGGVLIAVDGVWFQSSEREEHGGGDISAKKVMRNKNRMVSGRRSKGCLENRGNTIGN